MSKPRIFQDTDGTRQATVKQVLLEIIANRTGPVSSDEIHGALVNGWELPKIKREPRRWTAAMLSDMAKLGFIKRTGTHSKPVICKSGKPGTASLSMYGIAPAGAAFLAEGGGFVPKYKPAPQTTVDGVLGAYIALWWPAPRCDWRNGQPAAAHMGVQA